jgi:hypothetical protein
VKPDEAVALCRFTAACCPSQKFDEYTPDAWGLLLEDVRFVDAKEAVAVVARKQPFVSPSEIRAEVKKIRAKRIAEFGPIPPPPAEELDPDNWKAFIEWQKATETAIADGDLKPGDLELDLPERPVKALTRGAFQRIPRAGQETTHAEL